VESDSRVTLELTGPLERAVGCGEVVIPISPRCRLGEVFERLVRDYPAAAAVIADESFFQQSEGSLPPGLLVIRDGVAIAATLDTEIADGQRLTLMPMISGG
jgi:molybdopterin converting factor small subunit